MRHTVDIEVGGRTLTLETGHIAKQAGGSVLVSSGESRVLVTATSAPDPREGIDFFPLTVDYREYTYAAGRFPGGYIKREGRPSEKEVITSRLIDRPIRPLFPDGFRNETQVIALVLSADPSSRSQHSGFGGSVGGVSGIRYSDGAYDRRGARGAAQWRVAVESLVRRPRRSGSEHSGGRRR